MFNIELQEGEIVMLVRGIIWDECVDVNKREINRCVEEKGKTEIIREFNSNAGIPTAEENYL